MKSKMLFHLQPQYPIIWLLQRKEDLSSDSTHFIREVSEAQIECDSSLKVSLIIVVFVITLLSFQNAMMVRKRKEKKEFYFSLKNSSK